jgi:transcriptional regulator, gntR family protein
MKSLEYLGVVKQIRGKGVLVQTADLSNILKVVGPLVTTITPQILLNLFDFRLAIEPYGAAQAAKLATEAEIKALQEILEVQKTAVENNQMSEEMSFEFHLRLMQASHNEVIATVSLFLSELQRQSRHLTLWNKVRREDAYCEHKKVFEAIKNHDSELAFQIMKNHLLEAKEQLPRE